ncbi:coil containing protein [Vibrio phage 1.262.O._10N.286.51.A9]|nr:coil containing protein [Vibrio phage 1.262.O._10N.286.51.A9]
MRLDIDNPIKAVWCCDIECTGFLEELKIQDNPLLHNLGAINSRTGEEVLFSRSKNNLGDLHKWLKGKTLIFHNGITFDGEALKFFGYDMSETDILDSLPLSWYLNPTRKLHGLESWGETFGVPKPPVTDWINEDPKVYDHRVMEDCKITVKLWQMIQQQLLELYSDDAGRNRIINYLNFKMHLQRIQQDNPWTLDKGLCEKNLVEIEKQIEIKTGELEKQLPQVPIYAKRNRPAKPFKKNGDLSATGLRWKELTEKHNLPFEYEGEIKEIVDFREPNAGSHSQIKDWLFSLGWKPETFDFKKEKDGSTRKVPQVGIGKGKICPSLHKLMEEHPDAGIQHLEGLGILGHRKSIFAGFLRDVGLDGRIVAGCHGLTNTLRLRHARLVNLPSSRVLLGAQIRRALRTDEGYENIGSDLSSLEDRCKHHFQWKFDPEFVKKQMSADFDPHLEVCLIAGLLTQKQVDAHKAGTEDHSAIRHIGKGGNYACQYGAGVPTLMRQLGIDKETAEKLHAGYWKMNKSIKMIARSTAVKHACGVMWQWNPVSKLWYWLKAEKDRFSTLCQGLGSYIFDMWSMETYNIIWERWGREMPFTAQFHDELVLIVRAGTLNIWHDVLKEAIKRVDNTLKLNRDLDCDVQTGTNYSEIH